jgi:hypothetical protein
LFVLRFMLLFSGAAALAACSTDPAGNVNSNGGMDNSANLNDNGALGGNDNTSNDNQSAQVSAVFGYTDLLDPDTPFIQVGDAEIMPLFAGSQGGSHIFVTLRVDGFPETEPGEARIRVAEVVTLNSDGRVLHDFEQVVRFEQAEDGYMEIVTRFVFLDATPGEIAGEVVSVVFTLTSTADEQISTQIAQSILLELQE